MSRIGVVIIGRNEGQRLNRCLETLLQRAPESTHMVYVDSGSTDDSVALARGLGIDVVELDRSAPFTMARGRNAGIEHLLTKVAQIELIQFIDGDCEIQPGWIEIAAATLNDDGKLAVVAGRCRERSAEKSIYNRLIDMECGAVVGPARSCGGIAMMRLRALSQVGHFNAAMICGEEPELCVRLCLAGWSVYRVDAEMALHDAAMTRFGQWWTRAVRGGWAYAEGAAMHGRTSLRHNRRESASVWMWGGVLPLVILLCGYPTRGWSLLLLLGYVVLALCIYRRRLGRGDQRSHAIAYAFFGTIDKFPRMIGQIRYHLNRWRGKQATIIEYKPVPAERLECP